MANSILPNQIGFVPSGSANGSFQYSKLILGRNITGGWQSIGFGPDGQPDILQDLTINISDYETNPGFSPIVIRMRTLDLVDIFNANPNAPDDFLISFKEVAICESDNDGNVSEKRMIVLASQTYPKPT